MFSTTQKFPIIALAGAISFLATFIAFTVMASPARAQTAPAAVSVMSK